MSKGEEKIVTLLKKSKYKFEREKRFVDLRAGRLRYDFCIYTSNGLILLEFQGEQHYEFVSKFYKSRRDFLSARERDRQKISYALAHRIPIYIIPYWELENLSSAVDLFNPRFRALTRWKNDVDYQNFKRKIWQIRQNLCIIRVEQNKKTKQKNL